MQPSISLIIPCYNEGARLTTSFLRTLRASTRSTKVRSLIQEIVFVDDGSTDNTKELIQSRAFQKQVASLLPVKVRAVGYKSNMGRGYAIRYASSFCTGAYIAFADADLSIPLSNFQTCEKHLATGCDILIGSKKMPGAHARIPRTPMRYIFGVGHSVIANMIFGLSVHDYQGGLKIFSRSFVEHVFPMCQMNRWGFDMEVVYLAHKLDYRIIEFPVSWKHVEGGSKVSLFRDAYRGVCDMLAIRIQWLRGGYVTSKKLGMLYS